jgi:hypothetical protein
MPVGDVEQEVAEVCIRNLALVPGDELDARSLALEGFGRLLKAEQGNRKLITG